LTTLARECGRAARGVKVEATKRGRKFRRLNVIAAEIVTQDGVSVLAPACYTGATTAEFFETWFAFFLLPELEVGSVIIMDNASFHRKKALSKIAERRGFSVLFLPPYSPDFNRIEKLWANMKRHLRDSLSLFDTLEEAVYTYLRL
jgi:transposase